jgi:hypothetical protein
VTERSRRTLALIPSLVSALLAYRDCQEFERRRADMDWQETRLVFTLIIGTPLDARNLTRE